MKDAATLLATKLETHERRWRERSWRHFSQTRRGRMSWADWFPLPRPVDR